MTMNRLIKYLEKRLIHHPFLKKAKEEEEEEEEGNAGTNREKGKGERSIKKKTRFSNEIKSGLYINVPNLEKIRRNKAIRCHE
jgi:CO dehydrogenase/acetyl-CoA synthase beta subunit